MPRIALNSRRSRTSCSVIALATVLAVGASPAAAQSFNGAGTYFSNPVAGGITTAPNTTNIALNAGQTIIDWTPTDNAMNPGASIFFQNAGTTANFNGVGDFAVLNRITPQDMSRVIRMDGTINSLAGTQQRGSVYFYSPNGFVFGGTSVFNVGSLVVTTSPITLTGTNFINGPDNTVVFGQTPNPNAVIFSGGTIDANVPAFGVGGGGDSYVAMVAPKVVHGATGSISVNGSAALVAAEAATINFSTDGLFDIQVTVGSTSSSGVEVYGDIGGPTPVDGTDKQGIYLVAIPKNQAMTMVIAGGADLGFTLAGSAAIDDNGVVVLSAGHDVANGQIAGQSAGHGSGTGNFWFTGAHATNNLFGEATGTADLYSVIGNETTTFDSDVTVHADQYVRMGASALGTSLTVAGDVSLSADAISSGGESVTAGEAKIYSFSDGIVTIGGDAYLAAVGIGGSSASFGAAAGNGTGGHALLQAAGGDITIGGDVYVDVSGLGGSGDGVNGGTGTGGLVDIYANDGGTLTIGNGDNIGSLAAYAHGDGGGSSTGFTSGDGFGGHIQIRALANGTVAITDGILADVTGRGGFTDFQVISGNGEGGDIELQAQGGNSTLTAGGDVFLTADGEGGEDGECIGCGGGLGTGTGGKIVVGANNGSDLNLLNDLFMNADGYGAVGVDMDGGTGTGGFVQLYAADDSDVTLSGDLFASADGFGGERVEGELGSLGPALAGNGIGGFVEVFTFGTVGTSPDLILLGDAFISADGVGGSVSNIAGGFGGNGTGGTAWIDSQLGTIDITGNAIVTASGQGGDAAFGTGGTGTGRNAQIVGIGGAITIGGFAVVDVSGLGGDGQIGGAGNGGGELFDDGTFIDGAHIFAQNGSVTISGIATVIATGEGGAGLDGGFDSNGGTGGNGTGGWAGVAAANSNNGPSSISLSTLNISASATGGDGGQGGSGNQGGNGGAGGNATGGDVTVFANAGNGHLTVTSVIATAIGTGGRGGDGGNGDSLAGGSGGAGGNAEGGHVQVGTASGNNQAAGSNLGTATYGSIFANASATGGRGGDGNFGATSGNGGDGGDAFGGAAVLLVRGSTVTVDTATLMANATGGDAGFGYVPEFGTPGITGIGGNATVGGDGGIAVLATGRYLIPTQRGTLNAGSITGTAIAESGIGIPNGNSSSLGGSQVTFLDADGHIGSLNFLTGVGDNPSASGRDSISVINGAVLVDGTFSYTTPGNLSFLIDNGSLTAGTIDLSAGNFVTDPVNAPPLNRGTAFADNVFITSGGDFIADANFDVTNSFFVSVPGSIRVGNVHDDNSVGFFAGGTIDVDNIDTDSGFVALFAEGDIDVLDIDAGGYVDLDSDTGSIEFGNIDAGSFVGLQAGTFISGTDIIAGSSIFAQTFGGDINLDDLTSTFSTITLDAAGDIVLSGDLLADGDIVLTAAGLIDMNNATGGFFRADALGGTFNSGNITSGTDIRIFAEDDVTAGDLSAGLPVESSKALRIDTNGSVVVGNMVALGGIDVTADGSVTGLNVTTGDVLITEANGAITYDNISAGLENPQPFTEPVSVGLDSATSITVDNVDAAQTIGFITSGTLTAGNVTTGADVLGLADGNMTIGDITANGRVLLADSSMFTTAGGAIGNFGNDDVDIESIFAATPVATGGSITVDNVNAGKFTAAAGTSLTTGIIDSGGGIGLGAGGAIYTGNLFAGDFVLANGGSITTGNIEADSVDMTSTGGNITTLDITAFGDVELDAFGDILTGDITAGSIDLFAGDDITTGDLTTQFPLLLTDGGITTQLFPGASITLESGGDISTGNITSIDGVWAKAGGSLTTLAIDAADFVELYAGGNMLAGDIDAGQHVILATPGSITADDINAGGLFMALAHGDMSFGDATASEVFLADFVMLTTGGTTTSCIGTCGTLGANGVVIAPPTGSSYSYVTTDGGETGAGQIEGVGGTNGSLYTTSAFSADAGDAVEFWFNYVTSDGSGFADYSWAALLTSGFDPVAMLFTARTQEAGTIIPGQGLPGVQATLNPTSVPIVPGAPEWSALGADSGACYAAGCGFTGWVNSAYEIAEAGTYVLRFGVSNWSDTGYQSGMAFSGITVGGDSVSAAMVPTGGSISIGNVNTGKMSAAAGTSLTALTVDASDSVNISSGGNMQTGNISAGNDLLADAGGTMTLGALSANHIELNSVGDMSFVSAIAETEIDLDSDANISGGNVNAGDVHASAGGTATLNGIWSTTGSVTLSSNDIDIAGTGGIDAQGFLTLISTNGTQMQIGDGLPTGAVYALSNAEFGRISGYEVDIIGRGDASSPFDMLIGDLNVTGPLAGSNVEGSDLNFATGNFGEGSASGVIRVVGDVNATGFAIDADQSVNFFTGRFELDAATGSISIFSSGTTLGGELGIYADRIHVAEASILSQLATNPTYTGYQQDLNEAATVQRPEGVLRADTLWIESDNLQDILIQNTGTDGPGGTPAGFLVRQAFVNEDFDVAGPAGSINLIVNGQVVTEGGTLTGVAARDELVTEETDITPFTANSTINGCPLTGACIIRPPEPPPVANVVDNQIDLITGDPLGDSEFGNEDSIDDNQEGDEGANNPIAPPQPLFDTRPLIPSSDVNDPVSGTGNPALLGTAGDCPDDDETQCGTKKESGQ